MPKGEPPRIPDYLRDSVRSAAAYEQDVRREFQIKDYARKRQIPETSMENRTVLHFVTVLRDADAARERLGGKETKQFVREADPLAYERMRQASHLYAAEKMILEEGFQGHLHGGVDLPALPIDLDPVRRSSLPRLLDRTVRPFGLSVAVPDDFYDKRDYEPIPGLMPSYRPTPDSVQGLWTGAPFTYEQTEPWQRTDGQDHLWYWPDWPNERQDREHMRALAEEAATQGVDPNSPESDPVMHTLLTGIVYGRQLVSETEALQGLPPAPGMTPSSPERLRRVAPLNRLAVGVLEDAVRPGSLRPEVVVTELAPVLDTYGLLFVA